MAPNSEDSPRAQALLRRAVKPETLRLDGTLTVPRSWGVYEPKTTKGVTRGRRYRFGNHPIRQRELEAEFGPVRCVAVFTSREVADELQRVLNAG